MPKTLVIDNDPDFEALCRLPSHVGNEYVFASNDEAARQHLMNAQDLDIALVSVDSSSLGGLDLFKQLSGVKVRIPRIALLSSRDLETARKAMNDGAADFLVKPVSFADLEGTIERVFKTCEERRLAWRNEAKLSAIQREINIAEEIQRRILPSQFDGGLGYSLFARLASAKSMSGDFYDIFELPEGKLGLVVADVSGKGIPAAFFMAVARTLLRATAMTVHSPAECMAQANAVLCRHDIPNMFVSAFYGVFDPKQWTLVHASAGHQPPLLISSDGTVGELQGVDGLVLGVSEDFPYSEAVLNLQPGDGLVIYTDGLSEAFDRKRNQFGEERALAILAGLPAGTGAEGIVDALFAAQEDFMAGAERADDTTVLALRRE
ncbi:MAG: SpoIIE family protein phosphatase [Alphaproteobacteria bacterium]|nr:SpoIIE family protein phosphatase [Alphaproteobacteria bacterium]